LQSDSEIPVTGKVKRSASHAHPLRPELQPEVSRTDVLKQHLEKLKQTLNKNLGGAEYEKENLDLQL